MNKSMQNMYPLPMFGIALALGLVFSSLVISSAVKKSVPTNQVVKVRGVAEENIELDRANWTIKVTVTNMNLILAYQAVDKGILDTTAYLIDLGVQPDSITTGPHFQTKEEKRVYMGKGNYKDTFLGWTIAKSLFIKDSNQIDLISKTYKGFSADVAKKNIPAEAKPPFYFIEMDPTELKKRLLKKASENAYTRASIIAKNSRSSIGGLRAARQGEYTGIDRDGKVGGANRNHRVTSLITVDYALD